MKKIILLLLIFCVNTYSQNNSLEFFPDGLNFIPLKGNNYEAKIGLVFIPENNNMKIDIGNTVDLLSLRFSDSERLTTGIEFFAYALSRSYKGKRLQITAVDGFFGGNISYSKKMNENLFSMRYRIIHNSAHLVDGNWDRQESSWIDNYEPVPYAKDFMELASAYNFKTGFAEIKNYAGVSYAFLIRPEDFKRLSFYTGIEMRFPVFNETNELFFVHNLFLDGINSYKGNNNSMLGIKFGSWEKKGVLLFISYYKGYDVFHSFYKQVVERFSIGFTVDFL